MQLTLPLVRRALAAVVVGALALPAAAQADPVNSGSLAWTMSNVYESGGARTYLGYVTTTGAPFTNGTATPSAGATGATVTPSSPRGVDQAYPFAYGAATGTYDRLTGAASVELKGTVTFQSAVHGFTTTLVDPLVVIGSDKQGTLAASGQTNARSDGSASTYDRSQPVFDLDLSNAQVSDGLDGTRTISGIVPAIKNDIFGGYAAGAGPDRTPNTFGSFALVVSSAVTATPTTSTPTTTPPPVAPVLDTAPAKATVRGADRGATVVLKLSRDIAKSATKRYAVKLRRDGKTIATGTLHKRLLTLHVFRKGKKFPRIRGTFKLVPASTTLKFGPVKLSVK